MVGKTNVALSLFAAIGVTYPAGSTVTCANGSTTLKAKTTSGQWVFAIPKAGTWTVTATNGTSTKSQSVSITKEGQFEVIGLAYTYYLFNNGSVVEWRGEATPNSRVTIGETLVCERSGEAYNEYASAYTAQTVDVTNYSKLCITVSRLAGSYLSFGLTTEAMQAAVSVQSINNVGDFTLDISNVTGKYIVTVVADYLQSQKVAAGVEVTEVRLE